jgi:hypothetical protein
VADSGRPKRNLFRRVDHAGSLFDPVSFNSGRTIIWRVSIVGRVSVMFATIREIGLVYSSAQCAAGVSRIVERFVHAIP